MEVTNLFLKLMNSSPTELINQLDKEIEEEDINKINSASNNIISTIGKNPKIFTNTILKLLTSMETIIKYQNLLNQPIYLSEFRDKYGNAYIQARTSLKLNNKTKWITSYVGKIEDYPKGLNDPKALKKGQTLVRQKIKKHFGL